MMKFLFLMLRLAVLGLCLSVGFGFAGAMHPVFDTLSLLRPVLAGVCLLLLVFPMGRMLRATVAVAAFAGLVTTVPLFVGGKEGGDLRVYSKNLLYMNRAFPALTADIIASDADVVTLQELSRRNDEFLELLSAQYPHQHVCWFSGASGVAILARAPLRGQVCSDRRGVAAAQIDHEGQGVWIASVHLKWPFPYAHAQSAAAATTVLDRLDGPIVMAGDFNMFPWAASVGAMRRTGGMIPARPVRPTFMIESVPLLLDHIHAPGGGAATYRPLLGSDHMGVLADVWLQ